ncbi:MAG: serine/threonine-protein kinase [Myxococcota bacterium]
MTDCPADESLAMLIDDRVDTQRRRALLAHLDDCVRCRLVVANGIREAGSDPTLPASEEAPAPNDTPEPGSDHLLPSNRLGLFAGRYRLERTLGRGGMGVVHAAWDETLHRRVALKLLHRSKLGSAQLRRRLLNESRAMARLRHAHVVMVHDVGEHDGQIYIAMEYVDGSSLREWLETPRSIREILRLFRQAARGLVAAHEQGIIHRDFKPDNVLVSSEGRAYVTDFGLATFHHSDAVLGVTQAELGSAAGAMSVGALWSKELTGQRLTTTGTIIGTPAYIAPEQFTAGVTDVRTDVFAFCTTLYEALYRRHPFCGASLDQTRRAVMRGLSAEPSARWGLPRRVRRLLRRGLRRAADQRPASMDQVLRALRPRFNSLSRLGLPGLGLLGLGLVLVVVVGVLGAMKLVHQGRMAQCRAKGSKIETVWNADARARVREGLRATGLSYAETTADKVLPWIDAQAEAWRQASIHACQSARVEERWEPSLLDRSRWCLEERRLQIDSLVTALEHAEVRDVPNAVLVSADLSPVSPCVDPRVLDRLPEPPPPEAWSGAAEVQTELARVGTLLEIGKYDHAHDLLQAVRPSVEALAWPPMSATVSGLEGELHLQRGEYSAAEAALTRAYTRAVDARAWQVASSASENLAIVAGYYSSRSAEGMLWLLNAQMAASMAGDPLGLRQARSLGIEASIHFTQGEYEQSMALHQQSLALHRDALGAHHPHAIMILGNLGLAHWASGDYANAKALYREALHAAEDVLGPQSRLVASTLFNLATVHYETGAFDEARELFERSAAVKREILGPKHPDYAGALDSLGSMHALSGSLAEAKRLHEQALAIFEEALGPDHGQLTGVLNNLGNLHETLGAYEDAGAFHQRALSIRERTLGPDHPLIAESLFNLSITRQRQGELNEALALAERALAIRERTLDPDHPHLADTIAHIADLYDSVGRADDSLRLAKQALAIYESDDDETSNELQTRFYVARAMVAVGGDPREASALARRAREGLWSREPRDVENIERIDEWLATLPAKP